LWCIPLLGFIATKGSEWASEMTEAKITTQENEIITQSNRLVQATAEVKTLEAKLQPRIITPEKYDAFVAYLKDAPKSPVWVLCSNPSGEVQNLAFRTRDMLDKAGYGVGTSSLDFAPKVYGTGLRSGVFNINSLPIFAKTNRLPTIFLGYASEDLPTNVPKYAVAILNALEVAKIDFAVIGSTNWINRGKIVVIIPDKFGF
jgi:hypothetical protein